MSAAQEQGRKAARETWTRGNTRVWPCDPKEAKREARGKWGVRREN